MPSPNDQIYIAWIECDSIAGAACSLGCDYRRATAQERIEHDVSARSAVQDGVGDQVSRLDRGVKSGQVAVLRGAQGRIHSPVLPYIRAVTDILAELNVVTVWSFSVLEDEH